MIPINNSIVSGVALSEINGETKMLLMKRVKGGFWCHVAGSMEEGELPWQTIVREFQEETQIEVTELYNGQFLEQFYESYSNVIEVIPVFVVKCSANQEVILNHEHTDFKWCTLEEALELSPFPTQYAAFKHVWEYFVDKPINELCRIKLG